MSEKKDWQGIEDWIANKVKMTKDKIVSLPMMDAIPWTESSTNYQAFLEEASRSMIRFKKPEHLIRMIVKIIDEHVKTTHTAMLLYNRKKDFYHLIDSKGSAGTKIPVGFIKLTRKDSLIRLFSERINYQISESGAVKRAELDDLWEKSEKVRKDSMMMELIPMAIKEMEILKANICIPVYYKRDLLGIFILGEKLCLRPFSRHEISFFTTLANDVAMALVNAQLIQDLQEKVDEVQLLYEKEHNMFIHTAISLAAAIDARDPYTHGHTERVTQYAMAVADELEDLPEAKEYRNFRETLHIASLLHDVGKIGVPDSILNKTSRLTREEYERVKEHSVTGATILFPIRELGDIAAEIRAHHERYDGAGYPDGLKGEEIPFIARIIAVVDTYDAITSDRPYRQRKMGEVAVQVIKDNSGTQFDPIVVSAFLLTYRKGRLRAN